MLVLFVLAWLSQKDPPDPLEGVPEQPAVVDETGFKRSHDREFERNWHVVALQRDETEEEAEDIIRLREQVRAIFITTYNTQQFISTIICFLLAF